jgi:hypothetical protein
MKIEIQNSKDCEKLSIDELAAIRPRYNNSPGAVLIDNEIDRKKRVHQHELDIKLVARQSKWTMISIAATLIGVILGAYLTYYLTTSRYQTLLEVQAKQLDQLIQEKEKMSVQQD